jgi:hypothetical protein
MARPKGIPKTGGRQKGTKNHVTAAVKECILQAFHQVGGVAYLARQAEQNPTAFLTLLGKIVPTEVVADVNQVHYVVYALPEAVTAEKWQTDHALQ